ncbi:HdeD family acid-resistance protein [Agromyces seonyuensis]|uniref:DUF308 domain-containing protein n=1 Tax=Agromyces seonyuensis TaxID=2662446 RepID=A0A6I4P7D9_9MICO|nr:DUF308 domain-containing protein [Agromyces seonyuensis]MWB99667.1 hypothetical protein [Agromyces seonyuensis]
MSTPVVAGHPAYWTVPVVRAAIGFVPALVFTFNPDHTATFGLVAFGLWALVSGLVVGALGARFGQDRVGRAAWMLNGAVTAIAGILALVLPVSLATFTVILIAWAAVTGLVELVVGLRGRGVDPASRDQVVVGALTMVYAVVNLVLPADSATVVGYLGAYLVIIGVYLLIGGLSLRFGAVDRRAGGAAPTGTLPGTEQS